MRKPTDLKPHGRSFDLLKLISTQTLNLTTKVGLLSIETRRDSRLLQSTILIIEYAQIISQMILIYPGIETDQYVKSNLTFRAIIFVAKLVNPGYLLSFQDHNLIRVILLFVLSFMLLKMVLFIHVVVASAYDLKISNWIARLWRLTFKLQSRILFSGIASFWVSTTQAAYTNEFTFFKLDKIGVVIFSSSMILLEYIISMYLRLTYCYVLPSKSFLSSKGNLTEMITLTHKFFLPVAIISLNYNTTNLWILIILNLLFSLIRDGNYFRTIPLYNIRALLLQGGLLASTTSLSITHFIQAIILSTTLHTNGGALFVFWIILSLFLVKAYISYLSQLVTNLSMRPSITSFSRA